MSPHPATPWVKRGATRNPQPRCSHTAGVFDRAMSLRTSMLDIARWFATAGDP
jgi:hypothetical protein